MQIIIEKHQKHSFMISLSSYLDNKISSNELQLLFDDKLAKIKDNVVYKARKA